LTEESIRLLDWRSRDANTGLPEYRKQPQATASNRKQDFTYRKQRLNYRKQPQTIVTTASKV